MPNVGPLELVLVAVIALIVLGPRRLPEAGRALGQGIRGFRDALHGRDQEHSEVAPPEQGERTAVKRESGERHEGVYDEAQP